MKSSFHRLYPSMPFLLKHLGLPSPELDPILDNSLKRLSLFLYNPSARATQNTQLLYCWEGLFTDPLPSKGRPILAHARFRWKVFTESLPSNGSMRHNIIKACLVCQDYDITYVYRWHATYTRSRYSSGLLCHFPQRLRVTRCIHAYL
jgi:hypothetical protein